VLSGDSRAVLEGLNGVLVPLEDGAHPLGRISRLAVAASEKRRVHWVTDKAVPREVGALMTRARYERLQSGQPLPEGDTKMAESMAYFFTPGGNPTDEKPAHAAPPPPWVMDKSYVHGLSRPLEPGDQSRTLVAAAGFVVVELQDRATVFAERLKLPLDLHDVARVVVIDGSAKLLLPGGKLELDDGEEAELH
jgi:hypothetical protein